MTSNTYPQCLHLNSMSQTLATASLWPHFGHAIQLFRFELPDSIEAPLSGSPRHTDAA
jgi:hypothetical protein